MVVAAGFPQSVPPGERVERLDVLVEIVQEQDDVPSLERLQALR